MASFFNDSEQQDSRRRGVLRFAALYAVGAWLVIEVAATVFPYVGLPDGAVTAVIVIVAVGFLLGVPVVWFMEPAQDRRSGGWVLGAVGVLVVLTAVGAALFSTISDSAPVESAAAAPGLSQLTISAAAEQFPAFSGEGRRIAFSREVDGFRQIFVKDLQDGTETQVTQEGRDHIHPTWAPDDDILLYVRAREAGARLGPRDVFDAYDEGGDVWRHDLNTGERQRILEQAFDPSFSTTGDRIAFDASWSGSRRIWVADAYGRNARQITTDDSEDVRHIHPRWAPDGLHLVFQWIEKTVSDIHLVDPGTGRTTALTADLFNDVDPTFAATGDAVVFSSDRGGGRNLWRIALTPDGERDGLPRQLTTGAGQDVQAAHHPGGSGIAFVTLHLNADLWQLPVDPTTGAATGAAEPLVTSTREDSRGAWSPDGRYIAFNSDRDGHMNLWTLDRRTGEYRQITSGPGGDYQPRWTPDGRALLFFSSRAGSADIWRVDLARLELEQITKDPALDVNPFPSPDGRLIAFQSDRQGRKEVWVMGADGSGQRPLTSTGAGDHYMAWTPDGTAIIYRARGVANTGVHQAPVGGGPATAIPLSAGAHLSFGSDSTSAMDVREHRVLYVAPVDGGPRRDVWKSDDAGVRIDYPSWSADGRWVIFDRSEPAGGDVWLLRPESGSVLPPTGRSR